MGRCTASERHYKRFRKPRSALQSTYTTQKHVARMRGFENWPLLTRSHSKLRETRTESSLDKVSGGQQLGACKWRASWDVI
ncbi:hypothetical protein COEREDRAFT_81256 [Coemansia reversa NRRL 1564]|uniref:Uncharacterized protein n=1 Tax=Coemansia reversa (strain ATCC 12441 / NRRL 1564) TaxID=763665 RepID=A0A2G5BC86_COERN|nr:hypothetical protein COEREDRAFT_81256 [Coemansia reversa NRRL 1564]|eukprot:PIA16611.1 hypothetical protein COEREDRAFT_81256 [Coemansia reversa NRRL 1564]